MEEAEQKVESILLLYGTLQLDMMVNWGGKVP